MLPPTKTLDFVLLELDRMILTQKNCLYNPITEDETWKMCIRDRYTAIDELTPELLRLFIQRIEVGERTEKYSRSSHQSIRIVYRDIGTVDSAMEQGEAQPRIAPPLSEVFQLPA